MRSTCSLYVDAGYLLSAAATRVAGTSLRSSIHVEYRSLIESLIVEAEDRSGLPLLRVHWYDSARDAVPDPQQVRIGELRKVKLRLGRFGREGEQKGVDLRIGLDLVTHARHSAADVFFLVSGDDDLTEAVEEAQGHGVEVVVFAVPDASDKAHGVSRHLLRAADDLNLLAGSVIDETAIRVEVPPKPEPATPGLWRPNQSPHPREAGTAADAEPVAAAGSTSPHGTCRGLGVSGLHRCALPGDAGLRGPGGVRRPDRRSSREGAFRFPAERDRRGAGGTPKSRPSVPRDLDRALLVDLSDALDVYDLTDPIRYRLRERFWLQCR